MSKLKAAIQAIVKENGKRGTGRTTRMLRHALNAAIEGRTVFAVVQDKNSCRDMIAMLWTFPEFTRLGSNVHVSHISGDIQLPSPMGQVRFRTKDHPDWDWDRRTIRGFPIGVPVYVDHEVDEQKLAEMLEADKEAKK